MEDLKLKKQRKNRKYPVMFKTKVEKISIIRDLWFEYPIVDWIFLIIVFCVGYFGFTRNINSQTWFPTDTRRSVYQACMTISGTLLGLTVTSISVLNNLIQKFIKDFPYFVKEKEIAGRISILFFSAVKGLAFGVLVFLFALVQVSVDSNASRYIPILSISTLLFIVSRLTRMFWALSIILAIASKPVKAESTPITKAEYPYKS